MKSQLLDGDAGAFALAIKVPAELNLATLGDVRTGMNLRQRAFSDVAVCLSVNKMRACLRMCCSKLHL